MELDYRIKKVFSGTLNVPEELVERGTSLQGMLQWDSIGQINLICALEKEFSITFQLEDVVGLQSVEAWTRVVRTYLQTMERSLGKAE